MSEQPLKLPSELEPFREALSKTLKPVIRLKTNALKELEPWQSKLGGTPYLPPDVTYPMGTQGPLLFLAQINFTEMPSLPDFPTQGILEFYIGTDDLYGLDFDNRLEQSNFRVLYFPEVLTDKSQLQSRPEVSQQDRKQEIYAPIALNGTWQLTGELDAEPVSIMDANFSPSLGQTRGDFFDQFGEHRDVVWNAYYDAFGGIGHKIGGYPYFTQSDPRLENPKLSQYVLLFQLDSDETAEICWGDVGVGNFFIDPADLKQRDFSQVLYNWDCG